MSETVSIAWNSAEWRSIISQVQSAKVRIAFHDGNLLTESSFPANSEDALLILYDRRATIRRADLRKHLSRDENLLARRPDLEPAVVLSAELAFKYSGHAAQFETARNWIIALGLRVPVQFAEFPGAGIPVQDLAVPQLTIPRRVDAGWMREFLVARDQRAGTSPTELAVAAGLYLMNDFFDESHHCSQSIEGVGDHTGDYWHAILHRREPDYGNARYWFRHVGQHPVFALLAESLARRSSEPMPDRVRELVSRKSWEPMRFVDLCETAEADPELNRWCESIQYEEMQLLLAYSVRAAHSARSLD